MPDTIAYTTALACEVTENLLPESFYTKEEYTELINHPNYVEETHSIYMLDIPGAVEAASHRIQEILEATNCESAELYFTVGKNFRFTVSDTYKDKRRSIRYPTGLNDLKVALSKKYPGRLCEDWEADDEVVYLKKTYPDKYVLCAIDKDVLKSVVGNHFDYYHKRMEFFETDEDTVFKWSYVQCLTGDTVDNIAGLKGIGPKKAIKILQGCTSECEMWTAVVNEYQLKEDDMDNAIMNMRLVNMHQFDGEKITLWEPPCSLED